MRYADILIRGIIADTKAPDSFGLSLADFFRLYGESKYYWNTDSLVEDVKTGRLSPLDVARIVSQT